MAITAQPGVRLTVRRYNTNQSEMKPTFAGGRKPQTMKKNDEGFTLIELLIVIVILGILAAVVVFAVGGITQNAEEQACNAEERTVQTAVEAFRADTGAYPTNTAALVPGWIRETPTYWTVAGSAVTYSGAGGNCASL